MGFRDRAKSGLTKRLLADDIHPHLAPLFAEADYPASPWDPRLPRPVVPPKQAGQIIDTTIDTRLNDMLTLRARLQDPDNGAWRRTQSLSLALYGLTATQLADCVYGPGMGAKLGLD